MIEPMQGQTIESKGHKPYVQAFLIASALLVFPVLTLNILVDPYDLLGTGLLPPVVRSDRAVQIEMLNGRSDAPQALVLGSSRTMKISPEQIEKLFGLSAQNMGVGSCRAEGYLLMTQYAIETGCDLELIIVGVDIEAFHDKLPVDQRWNKVPELRGAIPELRQLDYKAYFNDAASLLSYDMTIDSFRSIKSKWAPDRVLARTSFRKDGVVEYPLWESQVKAGRFNLDKYMKHSVAEYRGRYRGFDKISEWRKQRFMEFLELCRSKKIHVKAFITTLHPTVTADLEKQSNYRRLKSELWDFLQNARKSHPFELYDFADAASYGGNYQDFWDGAHINDRNAEKLLRGLAGGEPAGSGKRGTR